MGVVDLGIKYARTHPQRSSSGKKIPRANPKTPEIDLIDPTFDPRAFLTRVPLRGELRPEIIVISPGMLLSLELQATAQDNYDLDDHFAAMHAKCVEIKIVGNPCLCWRPCAFSSRSLSSQVMTCQ